MVLFFQYFSIHRCDTQGYNVALVPLSCGTEKGPEPRGGRLGTAGLSKNASTKPGSQVEACKALHYNLVHCFLHLSYNFSCEKYVKDGELEVTLGYIGSLSPMWVAGDLVSKDEKEEESPLLWSGYTVLLSAQLMC